ncbi:MAG: NAD(P)/FAD-dependent oxidoreductase [Betaproteobacteria bacterium]|nr:NAD(P)/FAD-dependent oxidoreductase [Betaproteobacteria bacterium]
MPPDYTCGMTPHVVIIGCGFGGLAAARGVGRDGVRVTIIDRANHHLFQPLLYQVATAGLSATEIAAPIRHILRRQKNLTVLMADVRRIDPERHVVVLDGEEEVAYDFLIVASGARHSYFGRDEWEADAPGLKTLEDAFEIRRRILTAFERAEREADPAARTAWLTFVVIGAGATGVELAGTLAEIARHTLRGEFRHIDTHQTRVILLEGADRVLPPYPPELSERARRQLERLGVEVRTGCLATAIDAAGVSIGASIGSSIGSSRIPARTVIWAAGVAASPLGASLRVPLDRAGRVRVAPDLSVPGYPEIFVAGDLASVQSNGSPVPGIAPAAKQMGAHAARNVIALLAGRPTRPFRYRDYGTLATIGRRAAVAVIGRMRLWGYPAWLAWLFAHIYFLIGFRNRFVVLMEWAWSYWTFERHARIVIGESAAPRTDERQGP